MSTHTFPLFMIISRTQDTDASLIVGLINIILHADSYQKILTFVVFDVCVQEHIEICVYIYIYRHKCSSVLLHRSAILF